LTATRALDGFQYVLLIFREGTRCIKHRNAIRAYISRVASSAYKGRVHIGGLVHADVASA